MLTCMNNGMFYIYNLQKINHNDNIKKRKKNNYFLNVYNISKHSDFNYLKHWNLFIIS